MATWFGLKMEIERYTIVNKILGEVMEKKTNCVELDAS